MSLLIGKDETQDARLESNVKTRRSRRRQNRNRSISQTTLSLSFFLLCLISGMGRRRNLASARIFASENGFDNGGDAPVCWEAVIDTSRTTAATSATEIDRVDANKTTDTNVDIIDVEQQQDLDKLTVKELNEILFDDQIVPTFHLLKSCYNGTDLAMEPITDIQLDSAKQNENVMITSKPYTFRMTLSTELQNVNETFIVAGGSNEPNSTTADDTSVTVEPIEVWMRLLLCKATEVGFCSPYFDAESSKIMMSARDGSYRPGVDILTGWKMGPEETPSSHIATEWISWPLQPQDEIGNKFLTSVDMTLQLESGAEGIYFMLGHAVMYFFDNDNSSSSRSPVAYRVRQIEKEHRMFEWLKSITTESTSLCYFLFRRTLSNLICLCYRSFFA